MPESYLTLANLCPNLRSLTLHLCGQLATESIIHWGKALLHLERLELYGPFLVRKEGWSSFFQDVGEGLVSLKITQSPRIDASTLEILVQSCPKLVELRLAEFELLNDSCLDLLGRLKHLELLDLSSPGTSLTDGGVKELLQATGKNLISLDLSDNADLTDAALLSIAEHCPRLRHLALRNVVDLTDDGVASFFKRMRDKHRAGLETIDLEKGQDLKSKALRALVDHSGSTVERLSLMGWREVDTKSLDSLKRCDHLQELNLGWCRQVTDFSIKDVLDGCEAIKVIKVWGECCYWEARVYRLTNRLQSAVRCGTEEERSEGQSDAIFSRWPV